MTLDALTRANAEKNHQKFKSSLAQSRSEFRERFKQQTELFRSLPIASAPPLGPIPLSPIVRPHSSKTTSPNVLLGEDLVRSERLTQCCKRVRIWKRQTTNPLLSYKHQQLARVSGGASTGGSTVKASASAADHRMHLSLLMTLIVEIYEQKMQAEVGHSTVLLPTCGGVSESFPEFVIKFISSRAASRRAAIEQIHGMVTILVHPSSHARIRTFSSVCGLDDSYFPPEKLRAFLHMIESIHRLKIAAASTAGGIKLEDASSLAEVVFYNLGVTLAVAHRVINELFEEEYYWNFRFWHSHFHELKINYAWPPSAKLELEDKALGLAAVTRSVALNAAKKIDCDAFLELLLDTWAQRAKMLSEMLDAATDEEERKSIAAIAHKQAVQDARGHIAPLTPPEERLFDELVDEFWNAEVPWTDVKIQRRVNVACQNGRPMSELALLYRKHVAELDESKKVWLWSQWDWNPEWEWGLLVLTGEELSNSSPEATTSTNALPFGRSATESALVS